LSDSIDRPRECLIYNSTRGRLPILSLDGVQLPIDAPTPRKTRIQPRLSLLLGTVSTMGALVACSVTRRGRVCGRSGRADINIIARSKNVADSFFIISSPPQARGLETRESHLEDERRMHQEVNPSQGLLVALNYSTVLHHKPDTLKARHVMQRIARHGDDVGEFALFDFTDLIFQAQQFRGVNRRRVDGFQRSQSGFDEPHKLTSILAVKSCDSI